MRFSNRRVWSLKYVSLNNVYAFFYFLYLSVLISVVLLQQPKFPAGINKGVSYLILCNDHVKTIWKLSLVVMKLQYRELLGGSAAPLSFTELYSFSSLVICPAITLLFWFTLSNIFREQAVKSHRTLPSQEQTAGRHGYRLAGEHSGAFGS